MAFIEHLCIGTESENLEDISGTCAEKKEKERKKTGIVILMSLQVNRRSRGLPRMCTHRLGIPSSATVKSPKRIT